MKGSSRRSFVLWLLPMITIVSVPLPSFLGLPFAERVAATAVFNVFAGFGDLLLLGLIFFAVAGFFFTTEVLRDAFFVAAFGVAFLAVFFGADFLLERAIKLSNSGYVSLVSGRKGG
jgi:hypothetical protein